MRIWITGLGAISPLGRGADATMDALLEGRRALREVTLFDTEGCRSRIAAEVPDLSLAEAAPAGEEDGWSRTDVMSVLAGREALAQAGVDFAAQPVDLIVGGTTAGMYETEGLLAEMWRDPEAITPLQKMLSHPLSATADRMREQVGPFRRARTLCSACSSGANALLLAATWLRRGRADIVLAGGADGLCRLTYTGFSCMIVFWQAEAGNTRIEVKRACFGIVFLRVPERLIISWINRHHAVVTPAACAFLRTTTSMHQRFSYVHDTRATVSSSLTCNVDRWVVIFS